MRSQLNRFFSKVFIISVILILIVRPVKGQKRMFKKIVPHSISLQHAGGIGYISIGAGYSNKKDKLEGDLFYGYLPRSIGGVRIHSLSAKFNFIPYHLSLKNKVKLEPLVTGLLFNYNFGKQFFGFDPDNYPYKYYSFPTAINAAIFIGSRIDFNKPGWLSFYYELLGFDRDILNFVDNPNSLKISDVITLSVGIKIKLR